jgi:spore coat-associated protein N
MDRPHTNPRKRPPRSSQRAAFRRALTRNAAAAGVPLAALVAALAVATGGGGGGIRETSMTVVSGPISMTNSTAPGAILTAGPMRPGDSTQGTVTIRNGGKPASYKLSKSHLVNQLGPNGGALSGRLDLLVEDLARPAAPVYSGKLGDMPVRALATFAKGEARTYRFTLTLPNGGQPPGPTTGDNLYQGSKASVEFDWTATAPSPPPTPVLSLTGKLKQRFGTGVTVKEKCSLACRTRTSGTVSIAGSTKKFAIGPAARSLRAGVTTNLTLSFSMAARTAIKKALAKGKRVTVKVTAALASRAGSPKTITITIVKS